MCDFPIFNIIQSNQLRSTPRSCTAMKGPAGAPLPALVSIDPRSSSPPRSRRSLWGIMPRNGQLTLVCEQRSRNTLICMPPTIAPLMDKPAIADNVSSRVLLHAPYGGKEARLGSWKALVEAQNAGKTKSIGVSNYGIHHLDELEEYIKSSGNGSKIDVGQYELHPWLDRSEIVEWLQQRNIIVQAYSPLAHGTRMKERLLTGLGEKYGKSPAQIMIRWGLQKVVPLPISILIYCLSLCNPVIEC